MFERRAAAEACDKALVSIASGDRDSVSVIYRYCGKKIFFLAKAITGSDSDSEDVLQNTIMKILSSAGTYTPGTNAVAWILTVARSCALSYVRKVRADVPLDEAEKTAVCDEENETYDALHEALAQLDGDERQIVIMKVQLSMKHSEIADVLGITAAASQKRYRRAVEKLNRIYKRRGEL